MTRWWRCGRPTCCPLASPSTWLGGGRTAVWCRVGHRRGRRRSRRSRAVCRRGRPGRGSRRRRRPLAVASRRAHVALRRGSRRANRGESTHVPRWDAGLVLHELVLAFDLGLCHRPLRQARFGDGLFDNVGERAQLSLGVGRTIEAPGTTQTFRRCDVVTVDLDGSLSAVRRRNLVGALIGKASAVAQDQVAAGLREA